MSILRNPYNNVGSSLPPQPFGSVVDQVKNNENVLIENSNNTSTVPLKFFQEKFRRAYSSREQLVKSPPHKRR